MKQSLKTAVLIISNLRGGGAERSVLTLGQGFYELGYKVHVIRFKSISEYDLNPNLNYHIVNLKPYRIIPKGPVRYKLFASAIDKYILSKIGEPDIILSNLEPSDRVMAYSKLPHVMYVIRNNTSHRYELVNNPKAKDKIRKLQKIYEKHPCICISKGVEVDLQASLGTHITTTAIYNPFDKKAIEELGNEIFRPSNKVLKSKQYLLHVGSFKPQKAHDVLLKAYAKSSMAYPLVLLGQGQLLEQTKALAEKLGISDQVIFLGFNKNPYTFIKHARGLFLSSHFEGFGRVIVEAIALETPVVSTDCPSGPNELLPAQNLVPVNDISALASKMSKLMTNPEGFNIDFDEKFLPKNIAQQYIDYLACQ